MKLGNGDCNFTIKSPRFLFMVVSAMAFGERGDALWQAPACRTFIHSAGRGGGVLVVMTRRTRVRRVKFRPVADRLDRYVALVSKFWPPILSKFSADTAAALRCRSSRYHFGNIWSRHRFPALRPTSHRRAFSVHRRYSVRPRHVHDEGGSA
jgi:hypothetical protein